MINEMTLKEKVAYFTDKLFNDELLSFLNEQINQLRKEGASEDTINPFCNIRDIHIHQRLEEMEILRLDLFCTK